MRGVFTITLSVTCGVPTFLNLSGVCMFEIIQRQIIGLSPCVRETTRFLKAVSGFEMSHMS